MSILIEIESFNHQRKEIFNHSPVDIGRDKDSCLRLQGWRVGANHARLYAEGEQLFIEDLGSLQGTVVNNERIKYFGPLQPQDQILIGPYRLHVQLQPQSETATQLNLSAQSKAVTQREAPAQNKTLIKHKRSIEKANSGARKSNTSVHYSLSQEELVPGHHPSDSRYHQLHAQYSRYQNVINELHRDVLQEMDLREMVALDVDQDNIKKRVRQVTQQALEDGKYATAVDFDSTLLVDFVLADICGLGPLEPLLKDAEISEIMVNGLEGIFIEREGVCTQLPVSFASEQQLRNVIERIVAPVGRRVDESTPMVDARLTDGSRVHIALPPIALNGPIITIRKFKTQLHGWQQLIANDTLTEQWAKFLQQCVRDKKNMIISGGTGSGKTTLLNILCLSIPDKERIITIEDAAELQLQHPNLVRLEARPANAEGTGAIPIRELVRNALRMRPDRIIIGECRGSEAFDMLSAMNTGHEGSLTTLHANSPREALHRLESLVLMASMGLPFKAIRDYIAMSVDYVVQIERLPDGRRRLAQISAITGSEGEVIQMESIFTATSVHQSW